jgi:TetR/AcrR family acrAB operon transcriptional repressor
MRRTKAESEATRRAILSAARRVFAHRGVTRTTMEHVAGEAGVSRGAVYWHFANKTALFDAMRLQVSVPLIDRTDLALLTAQAADPLTAVERFLRNLVDTIANDSDTRQTFRIMMLKCEYVDEFEPELARQTKHWRELEAKLERVYARARSAGTLRAGLAPAMAALDTCVFVSGLTRLWLLDERGTLIRSRARRLIAAHVAGHRAARTRPHHRVGPPARTRTTIYGSTR